MKKSREGRFFPLSLKEEKKIELEILYPNRVKVEYQGPDGFEQLRKLIKLL